jgi:hypothetical protein
LLALLLIAPVITLALPADAASPRPSTVVTRTFVQVMPSSTTATSSSVGHAASQATNGAASSFWQSLPTRTSGVGQAITVHFSSASRISYIGVISGAGVSPAGFLSEARPKTVRLTTPGSKPVSVTLLDIPSFQKVDLAEPNAATEMTVEILSVYPALKGTSVAIDRLEFFTQT